MIVFQTILPLLMLMTLGYASVYLKLMTLSSVQAMTVFVIKIALPAFLLFALSQQQIHALWHPSYMLAYGGGSLLIFGCAFMLYRKIFAYTLTETAVMAMGSSTSNTGFMGTAILTLLIGAHAAVYISLTLIVENLLIIVLMLILIECSAQAQERRLHILSQALGRTLKNPLVIAILLGMLLSMTQIALPSFVAKTLEMLGKTASPVALFIIGASLAGISRVYFDIKSLMVVFLSIVAMPLLIFSLLAVLPNVSEEMLHAGTLIAALPIPSAFAIFAQSYGMQQQGLTALLISTVLGFMSVSLLIYLWF